MKRKPSCEWFDSERTTAGVPRDCLFMGLALGELSSLVVEGAYYHARRTSMMAGYRTYMVAAAMFGVATAMLMGVVIPEEVWMMLGAIGLGTLRAAVEGK